MNNIFKNIKKETVVNGLKKVGVIVGTGAALALAYVCGHGDGQKAAEKNGTNDPEMLSEGTVIEVNDFEEVDKEDEESEEEDDAE